MILPLNHCPVCEKHFRAADWSCPACGHVFRSGAAFWLKMAMIAITLGGLIWMIWFWTTQVDERRDAESAQTVSN